MLPNVILDLIQSYVDAMDRYTDLPPRARVRRLMDRCDQWVLNQVGTVLGMPTNEVQRLRFRLEMRGEFIFYFHMSLPQRQMLLEILQDGITSNRHMSCMIWIFLTREPKLYNVPGYERIFKDGLFCRLMEYLVSC